MDARLIPINAFIALTSPRATSWPTVLYDIGYRLEGLEIPVTAGGGRVVIDGVAFDPSTNTFLLAEGKSGNNIEAEQAKRYGQVDPNDLIRLIGVTVTTAGDRTAVPLYICLEDAAERIVLGLEAAACEYPLLAVGPSYLTLHGAPLADLAIAAGFADPVAVPGSPPAVILVDDQSAEAEFDGVVSAALVAELARGEEVIGCPDLASRAIPYLHLFAAGHRNNLISAVSRAARRLCEAVPDTFEYRPPTQTRSYAVVKVIDSPEQADPRGRTQQYQALKARIMGKGASAPEDEQRSLFDEIDLAAELEKADTGETEIDGPGQEAQ